jgi:hypothetical protein
VTLDWPVEHVACQVVVVEPRRLTALEWALLRTMEAFGDDPPTLEETADELGLGAPRFLEDTLRTLLMLEALTSRPGVTEPSQLGDTRFTERGQELFRKGQIDGQPQTQGHELCFDPFTDEALPRAEKVSTSPRCPVVTADTLSAPREHMGLDRVRNIIRQLGIRIGGADAWIRSARVLPLGEVPSGLRSGYHWVGHPVALVPARDGRFTLRTPSLTAEQRRWLLERRFDSWADGSRAITDSWSLARDFRRSRQPLEAWLQTVEQLVPVSQVPTVARELVASARREVLLHVAWASAPGVRKALTEAAERGVAVHVLGAESTRVSTWSASAQRAPGFVVEAAFAGDVSPALVVDGSEALLLDEVRAGVEEFEPHAFEVAGRTRARASALQLELRRALLGILPTLEVHAPAGFDVRRVRSVDLKALLGEPTLQLALARLCLFPDPATWAGIASWVSARYPGAERLEAIRHVAELAGRLAPESATAPWRQAWLDGWRVLLRAIATEIPEAIPDDVLRALFRLAPPQVTPLETLDPLVAQWMTPTPATVDPAPLLELARLRSLAEERWQEGVALLCPGFSGALARCLEVVAPIPDGQELVALAGRIARLAPAEQARRWGDAVADQWPAPRGFHEFEAWRRRHEPLRALSGSFVTRRLAERWNALVRALRARTAEDMTEPLRLAREVVSPQEAIEALLSAVEPRTLADRVGHLVAVRTAFGSAWKEATPKPEAWSQRLQQFLIVPPEGFTAETHDPLVSEIARRLQGWPGAEVALRTWVRALVETLRQPSRPEGVAWWLESLRGISRFLGPELQPLVKEQVRRHLGGLRDAQRRADPVWQQVTEAWRSLGLDVVALDALLAPAPTDNGNRQGKDRRKKR